MSISIKRAGGDLRGSFSMALCEVSESIESRATSPERRLIREVLRRAVRDLYSDSVSDRSSAVLWFLPKADNGRDFIFSFRWCCEWLDIDERRAREIVARSGLLCQ